MRSSFSGWSRMPARYMAALLSGTEGTLIVPSAGKRSDLTRLLLSIAPFVDARAYGLASERCAVIMVTLTEARLSAPSAGEQ
ncbi:hypothetical protein NKH73_15560 [Mesorhizobium sp. M0938]|uniref:hypothetical protein n=1 Tax=unclassified Mesorhizobium TaxID=325217 RepID=UPI0033395608